MQIWTLCNIALVFGLMLIGGCARESEMEEQKPLRNLTPTQLATLKNGYEVLWRYVFQNGYSHASTDPQVRGHWEGHTLIVTLAEYVPIYELFITAKSADGEKIDIPISILESYLSPRAQYLFVKGRVQIRVHFDVGELPQQVDVVRMGRI